MKMQSRKAAETQSEELNFAPSLIGDFALNTSGKARCSMPEDTASPGREQETELPEGWEVIPLGDCLVLIRNGTTANQNKEGRGHPVTRIETIAQDRINPQKVGYVEGLTEVQVERYALRAGDILFSHINSEPQLGRTTIYQETDGVLLHGMNLLMLRSNGRVDPWFLHYQCQSLRQRSVFIGLAARAVGQSSINQGKLKALSLAVPPLPEQRAIATVLRTVQRGKEACEQVLAATRQLKQSLLHHLFTYGPVPFPHAALVPLKQSTFGEMPAYWREVPLEEVAAKERYAFVDGPFGSNLKSVHYTNSGVLVIQSQYFTTGLFKIRNPTFTSAEKADDLLRSNAKAGDIVIAKIGANFGASAVLPQEIRRAVLSGNTMKLTVEPEVADSSYLAQYLNYAKGKGFIASILSTRTAQPALSLSGMRKFPTKLPPLSEQREIAAQLAAVDAKLAAEESRRAALAALFQSLLHHLMTGKVRLPEFVGGQP